MDKIINEYVDESTWRTKSNANHNKSFSGLQSHIAGTVLAKDAIEKLGKIGKRHLDGQYHIHNLEAGTFGKYCNGNDLLTLLQRGLINTGGVSAKPAKHFSTALDQITNYTYLMTGEFAGAQAWRDLDILLSPFVFYDNLEYDEVKQGLQQLIWNLSFNLRPGYQSPFTNFTFGLRPSKYYENLTPIVGGKYVKGYKYSDFQKQIDLINLAFLDIMIEGPGNGKPFTFPMPTYNITKDFDWDSPISNKIFELAAKWGTPYFANYINSDMSEEDALSMCFIGGQKVFIKHNNEIQKMKLKDIYNKHKNEQIEVFYNGKWVFATPIQTEYSKFYKITFRNGTHIYVTPNHLHKTIDGIKSTLDLKINDKLAFNKNVMNDGKLGNYDLGFFIGTYLAEGSISRDKNVNGDNCTINFSFGEHESESIDWIQQYIEKMGYHANIIKNTGNAIDVRVSSRTIYYLIRDYVLGDYGPDKHLSGKWYHQSVEFRNGLWNGWLQHDGSKMREGYTSSERLATDMMEVATSIGILVNIRKNISINNYLNEPRVMYAVHVCKKNERIYTNEDEQFIYVPITDIKDCKRMGRYAYCLEVNNDEHLFSLPNGLVTHNCCRLRLNLKEVQRVSGGIWNFGANTGSLAVFTINMSRIGYLANGKEAKFYKILDVALEDGKEYLLEKKESIKQGIKAGLFPMTKAYIDEKLFKTYFLTIGINGLNECSLNYAEKDIISNVDWCETVLKHIKEKVLQFQIESGHLFNFEATPGEGCSYSLAKLDKEKFPDIETQGTDKVPYYTGSSLIPMHYEISLPDALKHQEQLQQHYTGGTVFHIDLGELSSAAAIKDLIRAVCINYKLPYITWSPSYSICPVHGKFGGKEKCCEQAQIFSRVVGYYRSVDRWNLGKRKEFEEKKFYKR